MPRFGGATAGSAYFMFYACKPGSGNSQGRGIGTEMMRYLEDQLKQQGHRILLVETSGTDAFKLTRQFYENLNYQKEAVIRDFWKEGDDKVIYWKKLN